MKPSIGSVPDFIANRVRQVWPTFVFRFNHQSGYYELHDEHPRYRTRDERFIYQVGDDIGAPRVPDQRDVKRAEVIIYNVRRSSDPDKFLAAREEAVEENIRREEERQRKERLYELTEGYNSIGKKVMENLKKGITAPERKERVRKIYSY